MVKVERKCECCGLAFTARSADVKRGWARFCTKRCKAIKQEAQTGQYASLVSSGAGSYPDPADDQSWGEHEMWSNQP